MFELFEQNIEQASATVAIASANSKTAALVEKISQQQAGSFSTFFANKVAQGDIAVVAAQIDSAAELEQLTHYLQKAESQTDMLIPVVITNWDKSEIHAAISPFCTAYLISSQEHAEQKIVTLLSMLLNIANQNDEYSALVGIDLDDLKTALNHQREIHVIEIDNVADIEKQPIAAASHLLGYIEGDENLQLGEVFDLMGCINEYANEDATVIVGSYLTEKHQEKNKIVLLFPQM